MKHSTYKLSSFLAMLVTALPTATVYAADDEIAQLTTPQNSMEVGLGFVPNSNSLFGQYLGLNEEGTYPLLNFDYTRLDKEDGVMVRLTGANLGTASREVHFEYGKQGDWRLGLDYNQTPRQETYGVTTAVTGIGTANLTVPGTPTAGTNQVLKTIRTAAGVSYSKIMKNKLDLKIRLRNEDKDGSRLFARGTTGTEGGLGRFQFTPEPINSTTQQLEAILGYTGNKLQLSSGYYLSIYRNDFSGLNITETSATGLAGFTPIGLPPDNQAQQVYIAGGYSHSPKTRSNFKLSYGQATQNDTFIVASLPGNTSLDGKVNTLQAQYGVSSKLTSKLSLLANVRYMDRKDETPVRQYAPTPSATSTFNGLYESLSVTTANAKIETNYRLANNLRLVTGVDYDVVKRPVSYWMTGALGSVAVREETDETTLRVTLRRIMSETFNGSLTYAYGLRRGSDFTPLVVLDGSAGSNVLAPIHLANRDRQKLRLAGDWTASEKLSVHLAADHMLDSYNSNRPYGPSSGRATNLSLDTAYLVSDKWSASLWAARNETANNQVTDDATAGQNWTADLGVAGNAVGAGIRGKPRSRWELGADLQYSEDIGSYGITSPSPIAEVLPTDSKYQVTRFKLFGKYKIKKDMGVRVDYVYEWWNIDDWTWKNWTYLDGTQVFDQPTKGVQYIGVLLFYRF